ncbi:MAG: hypothetical protein FWH02_02915 [Oscillospiraceae bacterium]|nr:hypothetical protein [Oscillospiraceae bacterium]
MLTFEESQEALTEIADNLPAAIFDRLNGGILLLPDTVRDPKYSGLFILGQYHVEPLGFGRYITLHYGSVKEVYGHLPPGAFRRKLEETLRHELVHHIESLAGDRSLEIKDAIQLGQYTQRRKLRLQRDTGRDGAAGGGGQ